MRMKTIATMMAVGCAAAILTGCGVPQEEHDAKIAELDDAWAEIETLKGALADKESLLNAEKKKVKNVRIELAESSKRISALQAKETQSASALADEKEKVVVLESDVASAKSATGMAQDRAGETEVELAKLQKDYEALQRRFEQFEKNMRSINDSTAVSADPKNAMELLNEMSEQ